MGCEEVVRNFVKELLPLIGFFNGASKRKCKRYSGVVDKSERATH
jgi:hypothetical protein